MQTKCQKFWNTPHYNVAELLNLDEMPRIAKILTVNKKQRAELILKRAEEFARSGEYEDWVSIEIKLRHEGFPEARQILDSRFLRQELNEMCNFARQHRKK